MEWLFPLRASDVPATAGPSGWLYVLSNYAMPGCVKIGCTCRGLKARIRKLQGQTANPGRFVLEFYYHTDSVEEHETNVHMLLDRFRWNKKREFFAGSPAFAYYQLKDYFGREPDWIQPELKQALNL